LGLLVDAVLLVRWRTQPARWREKISRLCWRPWSNRSAVGLLLLLMFLYLLVVLTVPVIRVWSERAGFTSISVLIVLQGLVFHWAGLIYVVWLLARERLSWKSAFGWDARRIWADSGTGLLLLLGTMPILLFYTVLYHLGLQMLGHETRLQDVVYAISDVTSPALRVYLFAFAALVAPLFEEILFRGIALPVLARRFGAGAAVVIVSVLFALIHGHVPSLVPLFVLSAAMSLAYIYTESLIVPVVMHGLFNTLTVTLLMTLR
jgi:membrane protease YdiL (CAAX protease family)